MKSPIEQYAEVEAMKKVDVLKALDAQVEHTRCFGGSPSFQTMQNVRDTVAKLIDASRSIQATLEAMTEWDDGCLYYNRLSAPELETPMQSMADALEDIGGDL